ncbi:MAG: substrate-binding domain-containing protein [Chloroflexota bacterium]
MLESGGDIDAVFASNDQMALGVLHGTHQLGRHVPDDLSVVGVDNIAEGSHFWPSLTPVDQPLRDAGAMAVTMIDALIEDAMSIDESAASVGAQSRLLAPELIVRDGSRSDHAALPIASSDELPYRREP